MGDRDARDNRDPSRERAGQAAEAVATLLEVGATAVEFLIDSNGLAATAARLVALGLRALARWLRRSH
ncbi:hypothetical protein [Amycolatopsis sp. 195334CR]|uniref:hypothetical protein n=1 Tax=Amycolatopsis sp. 195334CR TaxID=2814588 RepID=UPI001A8C7250|nr:hypothetical protein [Amycolatopsis sp. 195334CR]MBN6040017.1 hypothetical protein [Amycolatopsis sp. 195334CR]